MKRYPLSCISFAPVTALLVASCLLSTVPAQAADTEIPFTPTASLREIMAAIATPASDALWNPSNGEYNDDGTLNMTNADWPALRNHAIALGEVANMALIPGRPIDNNPPEPTPDVLSPEQIKALIESQPEQWAAFSHALNDLSQQYIRAIDAKDGAAFDKLGESMNTICSACHAVFWYPEAPQ